MGCQYFYLRDHCKSTNCENTTNTAIYKNDFEMLDYLRDYAGEEINCNLLTTAAYRKNLKMFKYFVEQGVPIYCTNTHGFSVQEQIQRVQATEIQDYLEKTFIIINTA